MRVSGKNIEACVALPPVTLLPNIESSSMAGRYSSGMAGDTAQSDCSAYQAVVDAGWHAAHGRQVVAPAGQRAAGGYRSQALPVRLKHSPNGNRPAATSSTCHPLTGAAARARGTSTRRRS